MYCGYVTRLKNVKKHPNAKYKTKKCRFYN